MSKPNNLIKIELKLELFEYFEGIQHKIDLDAQDVLVSLQENDKENREKVLSLNEEMVKLVKEALESNVNRINECEFDTEAHLLGDYQIYKENLKRNLFNKYCYYAKHEYNEKLDDKTCLGFLLVTDWYLDKNQLAYLRSLIQSHTFKKSVDDDFILYMDSDVLNLFYKLNLYYMYKKHTNNYKNKYNGLVMKMDKITIVEELNNLEELNMCFEFNSILNIEFVANLFQNFSSLKWLRFYKLDNYTKTITIKENAFAGLLNLESLIIDCKNVVIKQNFLRQIPKIKKLSLRGCVLDKEMFNGLCLEQFSLFISNTSCLKIIKAVNSFTQLKHLDISSEYSTGPIVLKNKTFANLHQLETLKILIFQLEKIEDYAFQNLSKLKELYLNSIELKLISRNLLSGLSSLEVLTIYAYNQYSYGFNTKDHFEESMIDENAFDDLKKLIQLKFMVKNLSSLSKSFFQNLFCLERLEIYACCLEKIEREAFKNLENLTDLSISIPGHFEDEVFNGSLDLKNGTFVQQSKLYKLTIEMGGLDSIEDEAFKGLVNLKYLHIKSKKLNKINKSILSSLTSLEELSINDEYKTTIVDLNIEEDSFKNLTNLKSLVIYLNKFPNINEKFFKNLIKLEKLVICAGTFEKIERNSFKEVKSLNLLSIRKMRNPYRIFNKEQLEQLELKSYFGFSKDHDLQIFIMDDAALYI